MKVLVSTARKHGATSEIAQDIVKALSEALENHNASGGSDELVVDVRRPEQVISLEDYAAVVPLKRLPHLAHPFSSFASFASGSGTGRPPSRPPRG